MRISDWSSDVCSSDLKLYAINRHVAEILAQSFSKGWITKLRIGCDNWIIDRNVITTILIQRLTKGLTGFQVDYAPIALALAQKMGRRKDGRDRKSTRLKSSH